MRVRILLIVLISVSYIFIYSQENNISTEKVLIDGREYYLHEVQKGEGLFRISDNYGVSQQQIRDANDDITENLKVGQIIRIPIISAPKSDSQGTDSYTFHTVEKGQTAFFISRKYNVPLDVIYDNNPGSREVLSEGVILKIPSEHSAFEKPSQNENIVYHTVKPQETLYGLSKEYNTTIDNIVETNPELQDGTLAMGSTVRIPVNKPSNSPAVKPQQTDNDKLFTFHTVAKKETLFGISRIYKVDEDIIKKVNPTVNFNNLKVGEQLKIPTEAWFAQQKSSDTPKVEIPTSPPEQPQIVETKVVQSDCKNTTLGYGTPIKVALMLPFSAKEAQKYFSDTISSSNIHRNAALRSKPFVEFYSGTLLAVEALKKQGISINLDVYDISSDNSAIQNALNNENLKNVDLIIGPGVTNELQPISAFSKLHSIPLVYPMSNANPELNNNPFMFHINSPDSLFYNSIADEIIRQASGETLLIILPNTTEKEGTILAGIIKQKTLSYNQLSENKINYKEYKYGKDDLSGIQALIDKDKEKQTFIVFPSQNQTDVSKLIPTIAGVKTITKANITLFGMSAWLRFQTIEPEEIYQLNGTFFSPFAIGNDSKTKQFIENYRQMFNTEPFPVHPYFQSADANSSFSRYGIWGYDVSLYFISAIYKYGKYFGTCLDKHSPQQIQFNLNFKPFTTQGGYYNKGFYMIRFKSDFSTERVAIN